MCSCVCYCVTVFLLTACYLLYCRAGGGRNQIHTEGGYRRVLEAQKVSFPGPVVQLAGSRRSEQGCEVPHDGPLVAVADKQGGQYASLCVDLADS